MISVGDQAQISQQAMITHIINGLNEFEPQGPFWSSYILDLNCLRGRIKTYLIFKPVVPRKKS